MQIPQSVEGEIWEVYFEALKCVFLPELLKNFQTAKRGLLELPGSPETSNRGLCLSVLLRTKDDVGFLCVWETWWYGKLNKIRQLVSWVHLVHRIKFKYCKLFLTSELLGLCTWASRLQKENRLRAIHSVLQFIFFECNNTTYTIKAGHKRNTLRCITQLPCMYLRYGWVRGTK